VLRLAGGEHRFRLVDSACLIAAAELFFFLVREHARRFGLRAAAGLLLTVDPIDQCHNAGRIVRNGYSRQDGGVKEAP
jgi:hypothetical protein